MARVTNDDIIRAVHDCRGWLSFAARGLNIAEATIRHRAAKSNRIAAAIREAERLRDDIAGKMLFDAVEAGQVPAIALYLRAREAHRAGEREGEGDETQVNFSTNFYVNDAHRHAAASLAPSASGPPESGPI